MGKEFSFYGQEYSDGCPGCNRIEPQPAGLDNVLEAKHFRVHQDYVLPVPGMMVIETKRHVAKLEDLNNEEKTELIGVWSRVSEAVRSLGYDDIVHILEDRSSHFHLWILPVHPWMKEVADGKVRNLQVIFDHIKANMITDEWITKTEESVRQIKEHLN